MHNGKAKATQAKVRSSTRAANSTRNFGISTRKIPLDPQDSRSLWTGVFYLTKAVEWWRVSYKGACGTTVVHSSRREGNCTVDFEIRGVGIPSPDCTCEGGCCHEGHRVG